MNIEILPLDGTFEKDGKFVGGKLCIAEFESEFLDENFRDASLWVHIHEIAISIKENVGVVYWVVVDCHDDAEIKKTMEKFVLKGLDLCINPYIRVMVEARIPGEYVDVVYGNLSDQMQVNGCFDVNKMEKVILEYREDLL